MEEISLNAFKRVDKTHYRRIGRLGEIGVGGGGVE